MGTPRTLDARASVAWSRRFARTTPGVVGIIAVVVAACCVIAGLVAGAQLNGRIDERNQILDRSEPFAYAAQNLYADLSAADAAAATAYLSGIETPQQRARYQQALADAASALADATAGATDAGTRKAVAEISAQLAAYTGLVESARANNRQGLTIGSAYLREASWLMQGTLLPGAERIYTGNLAAVDDDQRAVALDADTQPRAAGARPGGDLRRLGDAQPPHQPAVQHRARRRGGRGAAGDRVDRGGHPIGGELHRGQPRRGHREVRTAREGPHPRAAGQDRRDAAADRARRCHRRRKVVQGPHRRSDRAAWGRGRPPRRTVSRNGLPATRSRWRPIRAATTLPR